MSDNEQKRTVEVIHREYSQLCSQAGHLQYNITVLTKDLELLNEQLKSLNLEAAAIQANAAPVEGAKNE